MAAGVTLGPETPDSRYNHFAQNVTARCGRRPRTARCAAQARVRPAVGGVRFVERGVWRAVMNCCPMRIGSDQALAVRRIQGFRRRGRPAALRLGTAIRADHFRNGGLIHPDHACRGPSTAPTVGAQTGYGTKDRMPWLARCIGKNNTAAQHGRWVSSHRGGVEKHSAVDRGLCNRLKTGALPLLQTAQPFPPLFQDVATV
jgi:hypothetical protein